MRDAHLEEVWKADLQQIADDQILDDVVASTMLF
jgi:hypothetical protein